MSDEEEDIGPATGRQKRVALSKSGRKRMSTLDDSSEDEDLFNDDTSDDEANKGDEEEEAANSQDRNKGDYTYNIGAVQKALTRLKGSFNPPLVFEETKVATWNDVEELLAREKVKFQKLDELVEDFSTSTTLSLEYKCLVSAVAKQNCTTFQKGDEPKKCQGFFKSKDRRDKTKHVANYVSNLWMQNSWKIVQKEVADKNLTVETTGDHMHVTLLILGLGFMGSAFVIDTAKKLTVLKEKQNIDWADMTNQLLRFSMKNKLQKLSHAAGVTKRHFTNFGGAGGAAGAVAATAGDSKTEASTAAAVSGNPPLHKNTNLYEIAKQKREERIATLKRKAQATSLRRTSSTAFTGPTGMGAVAGAAHPSWGGSATNASASGSSWGTSAQKPATGSSWGNATPKSSTSSSWGNATPKPTASSSWGNATPKPSASSSWGNAAPKPSAPSSWGSSVQKPSAPSAWGGNKSNDTPTAAPASGNGWNSSSAAAPASGGGWGGVPTVDHGSSSVTPAAAPYAAQAAPVAAPVVASGWGDSGGSQGYQGRQPQQGSSSSWGGSNNNNNNTSANHSSWNASGPSSSSSDVGARSSGGWGNTSSTNNNAPIATHDNQTGGGYDRNRNQPKASSRNGDYSAHQKRARDEGNGNNVGGNQANQHGNNKRARDDRDSAPQEAPAGGAGRGRGRGLTLPAWMTQGNQDGPQAGGPTPIPASIDHQNAPSGMNDRRNTGPPPPGGGGRGRGRGRDMNLPAWMTNGSGSNAGPQPADAPEPPKPVVPVPQATSAAASGGFADAGGGDGGGRGRGRGMTLPAWMTEQNKN